MTVRLSSLKSIGACRLCFRQACLRVAASAKAGSLTTWLFKKTYCNFESRTY